MKRVVGKKFDFDKPDLLSYFKLIPFTKKDFPVKKSNIELDYSNIDYTLLPGKPIDEICKVLMYGALKYGRENYKHVKPYKLRYLKALLRHLFQRFVLNEKLDSETHLSHLAHARMLFIIFNGKRYKMIKLIEIIEKTKNYFYKLKNNWGGDIDLIIIENLKNKGGVK